MKYTKHLDTMKNHILDSLYPADFVSKMISADSTDNRDYEKKKKIAIKWLNDNGILYNPKNF